MQKLVEAVKRHYRTVLIILGFFLVWQFSVMIFQVREFILLKMADFYENPDSEFPALSVQVSVIGAALFGLVTLGEKLLMPWHQTETKI